MFIGGSRHPNISQISTWRRCNVLPAFLSCNIGGGKGKNRFERDFRKPKMPNSPGGILLKHHELLAKQIMQLRIQLVESRYYEKTAEINHEYHVLKSLRWRLLNELIKQMRQPMLNFYRLRSLLIIVTEQWADIAWTRDGHAPPCPISYTAAEKEEAHRKIEYPEFVKREWSFFCKITGTTSSGEVSPEFWQRGRSYHLSLKDRFIANDGKYFPQGIDESDSTGETFNFPDDFERVLCERMGVSRQTFWRVCWNHAEHACSSSPWHGHSSA